MADKFDPRNVEAWSDADLDNIPTAETDFYEFKSSQTPMGELAKKIARAASGFANSGGGIFIAGVDSMGVPDGGVALKVGRQDLRDWVDQSIGSVVPAPPYSVRTITAPNRGSINQGNAILLIGFGRSTAVPHMAPDNKYYIRAGAHTVPAPHYVVEALLTHRAFRQPRLEALVRHVNLQRSSGVGVELNIVAANDSPALDVLIELEQIPGGNLGFSPQVFPKRVPLIDRSNPFSMRLSGVSPFQGAHFRLKISALDINGAEVHSDHEISAADQLGPVIY